MQPNQKYQECSFVLQLAMLRHPLIEAGIWLPAGTDLSAKGSLALEPVCIFLKPTSDLHVLSSGFKVHVSFELSPQLPLCLPLTD